MSDAAREPSTTTDVVQLLAADLRARSQLEWELLIIADWPFYSVSSWPKERHGPFAPGLPPERWCRGVREARAAVFTELRKQSKGAAIEAAEERAKVASRSCVMDAVVWTDFVGLPMHVQAAKSVLWYAALYPDLTDDQFTKLWSAYSGVAVFIDEFQKAHMPLGRAPVNGPTTKRSAGTGNMFRTIRSMLGGQEGFSRSVDLSVEGSLSDYDVERYTALDPAQRSGLLARFVASYTDVTEEDAAAEMGVMLGVAIGRRREASSQAVKRWNSGNYALSEQLRTALDGEILAGAKQAAAAAVPETLDSLGAVYGGVSRGLATQVALRARRLRALGGRTIGQAVFDAGMGELAPLAPIALAGPIRLQADALRDEIVKLAGQPTSWSLPFAPGEQALRDRVALTMANAGFQPRASGSFVIDGVRNWVVAVENERRADHVREAILAFVNEVLAFETPALEGYEAVALILCDGFDLTHVVSIPADVARAFASRTIWRAQVLDAATVYEARLSMPAHIAADRTTDLVTIEQTQHGIRPEK